MKRPTFYLLSMAALAGSTLLLPSCNKANDPQKSPTAELSAQDQSLAEDETAALADLTDAATRTLTLDFGTTNCVGPNGVARRGKIVTVFGSLTREAGAAKTITLVDYYRNDNQHTGTRLITRLSGGSWNLVVRNASITTPAGTHSWTASRTYTRTAGQGTRTLTDDEYSVTGQSSGTNRKGTSYTATIGQPLIKKFQPGCARTFVAGTVTIVTGRDKQALLNYDPSGTQACDNIASITINGVTRTIRIGGGL